MRVSGPIAMPGFVVTRKGSTTVTGYLGNQTTTVLLNNLSRFEQEMHRAKTSSHITRLKKDIARTRSMLESTNSTLGKLVH